MMPGQAMPGQGVPGDVMNVYEAPFVLTDRSVQPGQAAAVGVQRSTHLQATPLSTAFFSSANIERLQSRLRDIIRQKTGYVIDRQSDEQLLIVMRYVFMQSARHEGGAREVRRLNELVLVEIVPQVGSGLAQYLGYLKDASRMYTPMPRGQATSVKGTKAVELFRGL